MTAATRHGVVGVCDASDEVRLVRPHLSTPRPEAQTLSIGVEIAFPEAGMGFERRR